MSEKSFASRLKSVIGDVPFTRWATDHGFRPSTVNEWINHNRVPRKGGIKQLVKATGIPEEWWIHGKGSIPDTSKPYLVSTSSSLTSESREHNVVALPGHSGTDSRVNNFITPPKYDLQSIKTEGHDHVIHSEQIVDYLAFNKEWLDMSLNVRSNCLALISVKDDSMEPTLRSDDLILTDTSRGHIENNSIYVLQVNNELVVKRIQCKVNGTVIVKSDNPVYGEEEFDAQSAQALPVVGKVIWYGRRI